MDNKYTKLNQLFKKEHVDALNAYLDCEKERIIENFENDHLDNAERAINQGRLKLIKEIKDTFNNLEGKAKIEQLMGSK